VNASWTMAGWVLTPSKPGYEYMPIHVEFVANKAVIYAPVAVVITGWCSANRRMCDVKQC